MTHDQLKQLVAETLTKMGIPHENIEVRDADKHPRLHITSEDAGALIGNSGENLRALNYIVKKMVERKSSPEHTQFLLDVNGYQEKRIHEIQNQAKMLAERAKLFRYDVEMSPMNAYERMIVHATFTDDPEVETQSQGEGKFRRVVIKVRGDQEEKEEF